MPKPQSKRFRGVSRWWAYESECMFEGIRQFTVETPMTCYIKNVDANWSSHVDHAQITLDIATVVLGV